MPSISAHLRARQPSAIRQAQIRFAERPDRDGLQVINLAIGNVSLPMHPAMRERLGRLTAPGSPFAEGVVKYTPSVGTAEARAAMLKVIGSCGASTEGLEALITDGGSMAMELMVLGVCGPGSERPLLLFDPAYSNYIDIARRAQVRTVSTARVLGDDSRFSAPDLEALRALIAAERPTALVVIPADNPTGQYLSREALAALARLCVEQDLWLVSDEAYRQLQYGGAGASSIWTLTEAEVPGITGRRISLESASKVWNACGLRIGGLVTDNPELHRRCVAEYTANLCSNAIGQYIFGALAGLSEAELRGWYEQQRAYYEGMMSEVAEGLRARLPGIVVSQPEAALYSVIDLRGLAPAGFDAGAFVQDCAARGRVAIEGVDHTLLLAPLRGFYSEGQEPDHASRTQLRMAFVEPPEAMRKVPELFARLYEEHLARL